MDINNNQQRVVFENEQNSLSPKSKRRYNHENEIVNNLNENDNEKES